MGDNRNQIKLFNNPTLKILFIFLIGIFSFSTLFALLEKDVTFFDALYWAVTTCSTVGYGDLSPTNNVSKILTMFVMISGVALLGYLLSTISDKLVSLNMGRIMGLNRTKAEGHTIIAGWNPVAKITLEELLSLGIEVVVIDHEGRPEISTYKNSHFVLGNHEDPEVLVKAGIKKAENIILAMESDSEVILAINNIRALNKDIKIIGRIDDLDFSDVAEEAGCDRVVSPSEIGGNLMFSALSEPSVARWIMESSVANYGVDIKDLKVSETEYIGKTIGDVKVDEYDQIIGVNKVLKSKMIALPDKDLVLEKEDVIILMSRCEKEDGYNKYSTLIEGAKEGVVFIIGWNPAVRSAVDEFIDSSRYQIIILTDSISKSELEYYSSTGVRFIQKDINKLSLRQSLDNNMKNIIIGLEDDAEAILVSHIIKGMSPDATIVLRIDDPSNRDAAMRSGAGQLVSPSAIGGRLLAHAINRSSSVKWLMEATTSLVGADINEISVTDGHEFAGKKIKELIFKKKTLVLGVDKDSDTKLDTSILDDYTVRVGDTVVFVECD